MSFLITILCGMLAGFCLCRIFTPSKNEIKAELEIERNAAVNRAYMQGYERGKKEGEEAAIFKKHTTNDIRAALGFPPI